MSNHAKFLPGPWICWLRSCTLLIVQVPWERLRVIQLNAPVTVEGVRVTFVDANHCPGAAMIVFEPPGRAPIVHTGDCRCHSYQMPCPWPATVSVVHFEPG